MLPLSWFEGGGCVRSCALSSQASGILTALRLERKFENAMRILPHFASGCPARGLGASGRGPPQARVDGPGAPADRAPHDDVRVTGTGWGARAGAFGTQSARATSKTKWESHRFWVLGPPYFQCFVASCLC